MKRNVVRLVWAVALLMASGSASVKAVTVLKVGGHTLPLCEPGKPCPNKAPDASMLVLTVGTNPLPLCYPGDPCANTVFSIFTPVLEDGTSPMPLCYPPNVSCLIQR